MERQIAYAMNGKSITIVITNNLHPENQYHFSKVIEVSKEEFNEMINDYELFEKKAGIKIADGWQNAFSKIKNCRPLTIKKEAK